MYTRHRSLEFEIGDFVMLKVLPMKGVGRFGKKGKLATKIRWTFQDRRQGWSRVLPFRATRFIGGYPRCLSCVYVEETLERRGVTMRHQLVGVAVKARSYI